MQHLKIDIVEGNKAPKYDEGTELVCEGVVITEQGTEAKLPIVDFKLRGPDGKFYLLVLSGRLVQGLTDAIQGVNWRNHGNTNP